MGSKYVRLLYEGKGRGVKARVYNLLIPIRVLDIY